MQHTGQPDLYFHPPRFLIHKVPPNKWDPLSGIPKRFLNPRPPDSDIPVSYIQQVSPLRTSADKAKSGHPYPASHREQTNGKYRNDALPLMPMPHPGPDYAGHPTGQKHFYHSTPIYY